jgi:hypothetical protein
MNRKIIPVSHSQLTSLDLDAFVRQAKGLNQRNRERFTTPLPQAPQPLALPLSVPAASYHLYRQGRR